MVGPRCWEAAAADTVDLIGMPSGESQERGRTAVPRRGAGSGRTERERSGTATHPCIRGSSEGEALTGYRTKLGQVSREVVERLVTVAELSEMRQPDQTRIQLKLTDEEMQTAVCLSLTQLGAKHFSGAAPPSHFKTMLSKHLNKVTDA